MRRLLFLVIVIACAAGWTSAHASERQRPLVESPQPDFVGLARAVDSTIVAAQDAERVVQIQVAVEGLVALAAEYVGWVEYVESLPPPPPPAPATVAAPTQAVMNPEDSSRNSSGGGPLTAAQLQALANCENGGQNGWRTGYFGLEDGTGTVGQRSWDSQVAQVQQIYAQYGRSAWGCADQAGLP